jgi:hypothetical protein
MQNVACPITIVSVESWMLRKPKNEFSAMPVITPGRAIGSTFRVRSLGGQHPGVGPAGRALARDHCADRER